jgi:hypothetical protein
MTPKRSYTKMKRRSPGLLFAVLSLLTFAVPVFAHHSISAEFDATKEYTVSGVLKGVMWINPHIVTLVDVTDPKTGKTVEFQFQGGGPASYHRDGLYKEDWVVGEPVTCTYIAAKDGTRNLGFLEMLKYKKTGRVLVFRHGGQ